MHTTLKQQRVYNPLTSVAIPSKTAKFFGRFVKFFSTPFTLHRIRRIIWRIIKRTADIFISLISIIGLSPIFIIVAIMIKTDDGGPVFFRQTRTGKNGKSFQILKFRTCRVDNNVLDKSGEDQYTKVGQFLRRTSIDELPQLVNILKGEMSFIGPRPWITEYYDNMTEDQRQRSTVRPGLTGLAQVNGRNSVSIFDKIGYDLEYVKNYSLLEDVRVFTLTFKALFDDDESTSVNAGKSTIHSELDQLKMQNHA